MENLSLVDILDKNKDNALVYLSQVTYPCYKDLVKYLVELSAELDPTRIHEIDDGDYQGTLIFVIGAKGYQPYDYWYVKVGYGSCGGCDYLEGILDDYRDEQRANELYKLLHDIASGMRKMNSGDKVA